MHYLMSNEWIHKFFDNGEKKLHFMIGDNIWVKYNEIWKTVKRH